MLSVPGGLWQGEMESNIRERQSLVPLCYLVLMGYEEPWRVISLGNSFSLPRRQHKEGSTEPIGSTEHQMVEGEKKKCYHWMQDAKYHTPYPQDNHCFSLKWSSLSPTWEAGTEKSMDHQRKWKQPSWYTAWLPLDLPEIMLFPKCLSFIHVVGLSPPPRTFDITLSYMWALRQCSTLICLRVTLICLRVILSQ